MRYLVTGGAGFIGSNTVDELVQRGHSVVVLDDFSAGKEDNLAEVRSKITLVKGSITDLEAVRRACQEADFVLHLAARTSVPRSVKDPLETNRINVDGTLNVLVAARDAKVKRVVFPFRPTASRSWPANSMLGRLAAATASRMFLFATSTSSARGRTPARLIPVCFRNSSPRFSKTDSLSCSATASSRAISRMSRMWSRPICWRARRPMLRGKSSTSEQAAAPR